MLFLNRDEAIKLAEENNLFIMGVKGLKEMFMKFFVSTGEVSGDLHLSYLVKAI